MAQYYRCTKGHVWEESIPNATAGSMESMTIYESGPDGDFFQLCRRCLADLLGKVERVE